MRVLDKYIFISENNQTLPSHFLADAHVSQSVTRDKRFADYGMMKGGRLSVYAIVQEDSQKMTPGKNHDDDDDDDDDDETILNHLLTAVGALASCKGTGDYGAGIAVDMISLALKEDDALKLLHTW
jgi:hypothetical protein